jgi:hypothetical protein
MRAVRETEELTPIRQRNRSVMADILMGLHPLMEAVRQVRGTTFPSPLPETYQEETWMLDSPEGV